MNSDFFNRVIPEILQNPGSAGMVAQREGLTPAELFYELHTRIPEKQWKLVFNEWVDHLIK